MQLKTIHSSKNAILTNRASKRWRSWQPGETEMSSFFLQLKSIVYL